MAKIPAVDYELQLLLNIGVAGEVDPLTGETKFNNAISITKAQITATIQKTVATYGSSPDQTSIDIYNLSDVARDYLFGRNVEGIILKAGYLDDIYLPIIYQGVIVKVSEIKTETDVITTILCSSGFFKKRESVIEQTFTKGTPIFNILQIVALTLCDGLAFIIDPTLASLGVTTTNLILSGKTSVKLDQLNARILILKEHLDAYKG